MDASASHAALAEAAKIQELIGAEGAALVTGEQATEEAVSAAAARRTALHVEGPFRVNAASPLFSPVLLNGTDVTTPANNGVIEGREVPSAGFSTRVAVFGDPASLSMRDAAAALTPFHWVWRAGGTAQSSVRRWGGDATPRPIFSPRFTSRCEPVHARATRCTRLEPR